VSIIEPIEMPEMMIPVALVNHEYQGLHFEVPWDSQVDAAIVEAWDRREIQRVRVKFTNVTIVGRVEDVDDYPRLRDGKLYRSVLLLIEEATPVP
jgi:hypothetical protein